MWSLGVEIPVSFQDRREQVLNRCDLALDSAQGNVQLPLKLVSGIGLRPGGDERDSHTALVVSALLPAQWGGAGNLMLVA